MHGGLENVGLIVCIYKMYFDRSVASGAVSIIAASQLQDPQIDSELV